MSYGVKFSCVLITIENSDVLPEDHDITAHNKIVYVNVIPRAILLQNLSKFLFLI